MALSPEIIEETETVAYETTVSNLNTLKEKIPDVQVDVRERVVLLKATYKGQFLGVKRLTPNQLRDQTMLARLIPSWEEAYNRAVLNWHSDSATMRAARDWSISQVEA